MGIQGLTKLLADNAPGCIKEQKFDNYFGRKIAIDASMQIYSFLVVIGRVGDQLLTNEAGEITSHLQGMFFRTAKMLEAGVRPIYVFDGKPPQLKKDQLDLRLNRREDATEALEAAHEGGDTEAIEKYSKRTIRVTKEQNAECKRLLQLMGVPIVEAPSEAEAQCAVMCKAGLVYGVATEDMDSLTFGTPKLIRHFMAPSSQNNPINEFDRDRAVQELGLTDDQFIDLCILCGCDYCGRIAGIGPVRALQLIQKHKTLEAVLESLDKTKYPVPEPYPYQESREFFKNPETIAPENMPALKWAAPDEDGVVAFLVGEKNFNEDRVRNALKKISASKSKSTQGRLESFFGATTVKTSDTGKRKEAPGKAPPPAKKGKLGGVGKSSSSKKQKK